jgi:hypothetical protein
MKGPWSKLKAISAVTLIVTKCFLHGGIEVNGSEVRECSFDAALFNKVCKQRYSPHHMLAPTRPGRFHILADAMFL